MEHEPAPFDYLAWWTSIPGIPAGWPEPVARRAPVIALPPVQHKPEPAPYDELPAAA